ncbi:MAG: HAD family hydrolase [Dehalococcoidia bacterium]|nr:MAG: HAD family hydrolase [Dehalococcoidia bacterium]
MGKIKVVSFDVESTLLTPDFSQAVWYEGIPSLYAEKNGISFEEARAMVVKEYQEVGDQRREWYDIKYWFERFQLGDYQALLEGYKHRVSCYPEVMEVLSSLSKEYTLIVVSSSTREFLPYLLAEIEGHFARVFSSVSDYGQLKTPAFYLKVCQGMGILPCEMAHVGDSWQFDFLAPKEAGIEAFHLNRGGYAKNDKSLTSLADLEARLLGR